MAAGMHDFVLRLKPIGNLMPTHAPTSFEQLIGTLRNHYVDFTPSMSQDIGRNKLYDRIFLLLLNCQSVTPSPMYFYWSHRDRYQSSAP